MSFYGIIHRAPELFIIVNGGPDDRIDVLIDIDPQRSSTARDFTEEDDYDILFLDYTTCYLRFTHDNNGSVVNASFLYSECGEALDYVEDERNHNASLSYARLVLSWEQIRNDLPKAIEDLALKTSTKEKEEKDNDDEVCVICLDEYQDGDMIGTMVACKDCIKKWLLRSAACAICRACAFGNYSS